MLARIPLFFASATRPFLDIDAHLDCPPDDTTVAGFPEIARGTSNTFISLSLRIISSLLIVARTPCLLAYACNWRRLIPSMDHQVRNRGLAVLVGRKKTLDPFSVRKKKHFLNFSLILFEKRSPKYSCSSREKHNIFTPRQNELGYQSTRLFENESANHAT
mmetsp:Transcript_5891/g.11640  ORF Transcript_5891/g.11640 Transcript_5891/m.11640 type:complete len:161 (-) Transcript_5891:36-518(-)